MQINTLRPSIPAVACLAAALSIFSLGCGNKEQPSTQKDDSLEIAGIVFQEDQFFRLVQYGMKDAAKKADAKLLIANSANKPDKEIQLVNTYIATDVDGLVISPLSRTASATALKRAHEQGIKIVTYNSTIEGDIPTSYVESDQQNLGAQTGETTRKYINDKLDGKAKIAILAFKSNLPEQSEARTSGFKSQIEGMQGVTIVAEQDAWLPEMAVKKVGDILTAHPDVDIIWSANEGGTVGAVMAVKNANKADQIAVFGTDISDQLISFLLSNDNILQAVTGQKPFDIGSTAVDFLVKSLKGLKVPKKVSMPGVLLSRDNPEQIRQYRERLNSLISGG